MSRSASFTPRDIRLMLGFGLFMEVVLGYMLLVDGPLTRLQRMGAQLEKTKEAYTTLQQAVRSQQGSSPEKLPPVLGLEPGQSASLALQTYLDRLTGRHAVTLLGSKILVQEGPACRMEVEVRGSYEAIGGLIAELERPEILVGIDGMTLQTDTQDPDRLRADLKLFFFTRQAPRR